MNETTRNILAEAMVRDWLMVYAGIPGHRPAEWELRGTADAAVAEYRNRTGQDVRLHRIVMDDGVWTIRAVMPDRAIAVLFAAE